MQILDTQKRKDMIPIVQEAHDTAMERLRRAYSSEEALNVLDRLKDMRVEFSERMGTAAGRAYFRGNYDYEKKRTDWNQFAIRLNARLLALNPSHLVPTYLHELAHIVANLLSYKKTGHGPLWKAVMHTLQADDSRCHTLDVSAFQKPNTKFSYSCLACGRDFELSKTRHARQQRAMGNGTYAYRCKCAGRIVHNP